MGSSELYLGAELAVRVPCGLAGVDCPPEIGSPPCSVTDAQIADIDDCAVFRHVIACQRDQRDEAHRGYIPDPKTGVDSVELMMAKARSRFLHPTRKSEQVASAEGVLKSTALIAFGDGNNFGELNEAHGHSFGDEVLNALVKILRRNIRVGDFLARWSGGSDEFVALMLGLNRAEADRKIDTLQADLAAGYPLVAPNRQIVVVTGAVASVYIEGLSDSLEGLREIRSAIDTADQALGRWKRSERVGQPERQYLVGTQGGL